MEKVHWKTLRLVHTSQSQYNKTPGKKYWEWIEEGREEDGAAGKKSNKVWIKGDFYKHPLEN